MQPLTRTCLTHFFPIYNQTQSAGQTNEQTRYLIQTSHIWRSEPPVNLSQDVLSIVALMLFRQKAAQQTINMVSETINLKVVIVRTPIIQIIKKQNNLVQVARKWRQIRTRTQTQTQRRSNFSKSRTRTRRRTRQIKYIYMIK